MIRRARFRCRASATLLVLLLGVASRSPAAEDGLAPTLRELGRAGAGVTTLRARFLQEKHLTIVRDVLRCSGTFLLDKKLGVVWNVAEPSPARVVIRHDGVFVDGRQVGAHAPGGGDGGASASPVPMLESLNGIFAGLSEDTTRQFAVTRVGEERFRLKPRSAALARWLSALEITVDPKTRMPAEVRIDEPGGDWTEITFSDLVVNPTLGATAFAP